jgi:hypothetical protein
MKGPPSVRSAPDPTTVSSRLMPVSSSLPAPAGVRGGLGMPWCLVTGRFLDVDRSKRSTPRLRRPLRSGGLLDMLGPDRRHAIARSLSVVGSDEWVSTPDAIELVKGAIGDREPKRFIVDQARLGSLQVGRSRPSVSRNDRIPNWFGTSGNGMSRRGCGIVLVGSQAKRTGARVSSGLASQKLSAQVG